MSSENFSTVELLFVHIHPCPSLPVQSDGKHKEVHDQGADGASNGDRPHPGQDDVSEKLPVHVLFGPDTPHRHHRADLTVGGADRDPHIGRQKNSQSRTNLNAEPTWGGSFGKILSQGFDDSSPPHPQPNDDSGSSIHQDPDGGLSLLSCTSLRTNYPQGNKRSNRIADVVSSMSKRSEHGG